MLHTKIDNSVRAKFEEKTYENYFNTELSNRSDIYFPLGQVQEGSLGFDSSAFSNNRRLWRRLSYPFWFFPQFRGVGLRDIADEMEHILGVELDNIPVIKTNLLFQYKKPEYIAMRSGKEWSLWNEPYFRYDIYEEQQELLMSLHTIFGTRVFIVYASPSIHDVNELVEVYLNQQIIENSNFRRAFELNGHHRNTYINAGTFSIACSEPSKLENLDLLNELERISEINSKNKKEDNRQIIKNFTKGIISIILENHYFAESFNRLNERYTKVNTFELFYSFLVMANFRQLTGIQWLIKL